MRRRRRRWREPVYVWWAVFALLGVAAILTKSWRLALLGVLLWCLYEFCLVPTACGVLTRQGYTCLEPVRGRLFACGAEHQQIKNDALWRLAGLSNPFHKPPPPPDPNRTTGMLVVSPQVRGRLSGDDRILLTVASLLTLLTVIGMLAGLRA
ncbi:MAG TPA: hypothetical protein VFU43_07960 [Streptosporangiaceae bacterium]|nr:hypothetical protein [Streptosporangiaceae bacterium]